MSFFKITFDPIIFTLFVIALFEEQFHSFPKQEISTSIYLTYGTSNRMDKEDGVYKHMQWNTTQP